MHIYIYRFIGLTRNYESRICMVCRANIYNIFIGHFRVNPKVSYNNIIYIGATHHTNSALVVSG